MNKRELIQKLSLDAGLTKTQARKVLDCILMEIVNSVSRGEIVNLRGFGTFKSKARKARKGVNPITKEGIIIPAITIAKFIPGYRLKKAASAIPIPSIEEEVVEKEEVSPPISQLEVEKPAVVEEKVEPVAEVAEKEEVAFEAPAPPMEEVVIKDPEHERAARMARVMVADLYLYNRDKFERAALAGNVREVLAIPIKDMQNEYNRRVPHYIREQRDYLNEELEKLIKSKAKR